MADIIEPSRHTVCFGEYDTVVCGGGVAGMAAALASARNGAKTILLEKSYMLGGLATAGLITIFLPICDGNGHQVSFGICEELLRFSVRHGTDSVMYADNPWLDGNSEKSRNLFRFECQYNPSVFALECEGLLSESGVEILLGAYAVDTVVEGDRIEYVIIEGKSGRQAIKCKTVVDCTGDADIVHFSGEREALYGGTSALAGWYYRLENGRNILRMLGVKDTDSSADTEGSNKTKTVTSLKEMKIDTELFSVHTVKGHRLALEDFLKSGEITPDYAVTTIPTVPQLRMTRRIVGAGTMTYEDNHKEFSDSVGLFGDWLERGRVYEMRFSALHGEKIKNLICAGRNISVTDEMWDISRVIPPCIVAGEAAGTAAAIFDDFTDIDIVRLRKRLQDNGVVLHERNLK